MTGQVVTAPAYSRLVKLRDGSEILVRPLCYEDKNKFLNMFNRLTSETKFLRYHYVKLRLTAEELEDYCTLDYINVFVLLAEKKYNGD